MGVRERVFVLALLVCATAQQFPPSEILTTLTAVSDDTCGDPAEVFYDPQLGKKATCNASIPEDAHPPNVVVDGQDNDEWWQSKGGQNESSIEIDLGDVTNVGWESTFYFVFSPSRTNYRAFV